MTHSDPHIYLGSDSRRTLPIIFKMLSPFLLLPVLLVNLANGMNFFGAAINYTFLLLVIASLIYGSFTLLTIIIIANFVLGPFQLFSITIKEYENFGRLDYFLGNLCFFYFLSAGVRLGVEKYLSALVSVFIISGVIGAYINGSVEMEAFIASAYKYMSNLVLAYVTIICLNKSNAKILVVWVSALLLAHFLLSLIQLKYALNIRAGTIPASLSVMGFELRRPAGLFENSYVYGVNTGLLIFLLFILKPNLGLGYRCFVAALVFMSVLATRSFFLGLVMFAYIVWVGRLLRNPLALVLLPMGTLAILILVLGLEAIFTLEQSNSTKFMIWFLVLKDMVDLNPLQLLFGSGLAESANIAGSLSEFASEYGAAYDNNVDKFGSFPIHNIYLELLYDFGILSFLMVIFPLMTSFISLTRMYLVSKQAVAPEIFFFCIISSNYFLHNGLFSMPFCFLLIICMLVVHGNLDLLRPSRD